MVGQTVGKYRVVSRLGRGGMGTVYKAVDETLDRDVAIKSLNADLGDPDLLKRFRAEAITLARLNHPNIATLYELTEYEGQLLMVMEYVRGETLDRLSQREGPMPIGRAAQFCVQVLDALEHAHGVGIVHRDLKPANLMLTESGLVKVMDFGLARMVGSEHLTTAGYMVGTPAYMSPEQVLGREIDGRADIYSMGVVLFRLLTAQLPFKADSGIAMVHRQLNDVPTPVRQIRSELPEAVESVIARALAKAASDRYQTADEFRRALTQLDPALASTGISRISVVAPAPPDPAATLATPALPPVSAPPTTTSVPPSSPATLVLTQPEEGSSAASPVPPEQGGTERLVPEQPQQRAAAEPPAAGPPVTPASSGTIVSPAAPAAPVSSSAPARARTAAAITSSAAPGATKSGAKSAVVPIAIAVALLLLAGIPAALFWRAHKTASAAPAAGSTSASAAAATPPVTAPAPAPTPPPAAVTESPAPTAPVSDAAVPSAPAATPPDTGAPSSAASPGTPPAFASRGPARSAAPSSSSAKKSAPPVKSTAGASAVPATSAAPPEPRSENAVAPSLPPTPAPAAALPDVTFGKLKLLIVDEAKTRDRDAALRLGRDGLEVVDGATTLHRASYSDVIGVYYSHSKEPRWTTAAGQSLAVAKAGSAFGLFRGTPDWITVRTKQVFIPLRVREDDVRKLTNELEARTGTRVVTTK